MPDEIKDRIGEYIALLMIDEPSCPAGGSLCQNSEWQKPTLIDEERNRDRRRMDVVIHYRGRRYIIELKIWHGDRYNAKAERQIMDYLDSYGLDTGYLLSFNFNKINKAGVEKVRIGEKTVYEGIV